MTVPPPARKKNYETTNNRRFDRVGVGVGNIYTEYARG
jgi:hypothetical protein